MAYTEIYPLGDDGLSLYKITRLENVLLRSISNSPASHDVPCTVVIRAATSVASLPFITLFWLPSATTAARCD